MSGRRVAIALILVGAVTAVVGCAGGVPGTAVVSRAPTAASPAPQESTSPAAATLVRPADAPVEVAADLAAPWSVVVRGETQLVSERDSGAILEVRADGSVREIARVAEVAAGGEAGLHGLALFGGDAEEWLYAYVGTAEDNRVVRMPLRGDPVVLGVPEVVISGIPRDRVHNGGRIAFGPDGLLYVTTGDASVRDAAQDASSLAGKILRLTPTGEPAPGNPFESEVYSLGHRNVQGIAWTDDGAMWASEFGQDTFDELNRIEPGGNYGWPVREGVGGGDDDGFIDPVVTWDPDESSPSGLAAYGRTLFVAGLGGERLWLVDVSGGGVVGEPEALWVGEYGRLRDVVVSGEDLWVLTNNTDGRGDPGPTDDRLLRVALEPRA